MPKEATSAGDRKLPRVKFNSNQVNHRTGMSINPSFIFHLMEDLN